MDFMERKIVLMEQYQYSELNADKMAKSLAELDPMLAPVLQKWEENGEEQDAREFSGYSIDSLRATFGMNFFAALVTLDWILKEPDKALHALKQGIK